MHPDFHLLKRIMALMAGAVTAAWMAGVSAPAMAHLEGTCLMRLADSAEAEQQCQAHKTAAQACQPAQQARESAEFECLAQLYTLPDMEHAIEHGKSRVAGSAEDSPYQKAMITSARRQALTETNQENFQAFFGLDKQHYHEMTDDYFDEPDCPGAFRGSSGRYRMVGTRVFARLAIERDEAPVTPSITWHFYEAMAPDRCVSAPKAGEKSPWGALAIVNIPRELLLEVATDRKRNKVYLCVSQQDCQLQLDKLTDLQRQYAEHIQVYHRLQDCSIGSAIKKGFRFTKAAQAPLVGADAFCQQGELDTLLLNERKFIQELEGGLFEHGRLP